MSAAPATQVSNGATCGGSVISVPDPPAPGGELGHSILIQPAASIPTGAGSGPNAGYTYVAAPISYAPSYCYVITPQLANTASAFYTAQCGNYNPSTNTGYISGSFLLSNTQMHESGTPGHYGQYVQAQNDPANNLGTVAEAVTAKPGQGINQALNEALSAAQSRTVSAMGSEALLCGGDLRKNASSSCAFMGYINYAPYAQCPQ